MVASIEMVNCEPEYSTLAEATKAARSHSTQDAGVSPHAAKGGVDVHSYVSKL